MGKIGAPFSRSAETMPPPIWMPISDPGCSSSWISSKSDSPNADPAKPKVKAAASPTAIRRMAVPPQSPCSQEFSPALLAQL
jgi:hypothetical protein